jgi:hypothetical protein
MALMARMQLSRQHSQRPGKMIQRCLCRHAGWYAVLLLVLTTASDPTLGGSGRIAGRSEQRHASPNASSVCYQAANLEALFPTANSMMNRSCWIDMEPMQHAWSHQGSERTLITRPQVPNFHIVYTAVKVEVATRPLPKVSDDTPTEEVQPTATDQEAAELLIKAIDNDGLPRTGSSGMQAGAVTADLPFVICQVMGTSYGYGWQVMGISQLGLHIAYAASAWHAPCMAAAAHEWHTYAAPHEHVHHHCLLHAASTTTQLASSNMKESRACMHGTAYTCDGAPDRGHMRAQTPACQHLHSNVSMSTHTAHLTLATPVTSPCSGTHEFHLLVKTGHERTWPIDATLNSSTRSTWHTRAHQPVYR